MDHARQVALLQRAFALLDKNGTDLGAETFHNSVANYTDPQRLQHEYDQLFQRLPIFVGLTQDLAEPGSYLTALIGRVPVIVLRTRSGELRALLNVCRHRGAPVLSGCGKNNGRLTCPYHGWTYDTDGRLLVQPGSDGFSGIDKGDLGLVSLPLAEYHGMIFVAADTGIDLDMANYLSGATEELAAYGLENYTRFASTTARYRMNWKLVIDTFLEAYHVPSLHHQSLSAGILGTPSLWDAFGFGSRMIALRRSVTRLRELPPAQWNLLAHAVILYNLFPNTMLIHQIDHVEIIQAIPGAGGPDDSVVQFSLYTPQPVADEKARKHFQANFDLLLTAVAEEDFPLCEQIQQGFHAPQHPGVIYGRNEPGVAHYHRMIQSVLGASSGA